MKVVNVDDSYRLYNNSLKVFEQLPAKTYTVNCGKFTGFFLEDHPDFTVTEKVYGDHIQKVEKVLKAYSIIDRNLGVILSGYKGSGKSFFARILCEKAIQCGLPVIIVDTYYEGIAGFLESIEQNCVVLFDEFDKTFSNNRHEDNVIQQETLLSMFDGLSVGKKMFLITCNDLRKVNNLFLNRPGRFHYHFQFNTPTHTEIKEYLRDNLIEDAHDQIDAVIAFSDRVNLNFDCLRAIAFELNMKESFSQAIENLNIINVERESYKAIISFEDGTTFPSRLTSADLFDEDSTVCFTIVDKSDNYLFEIYFGAEHCVYNSLQTTTIVDGKYVHINDMDEDFDIQKHGEILNVKLIRKREQNLHYTV